MIKPVFKGEAFLKNVETASRASERLSLWWLGQSGFLVQWNGHHLLFDPYLSNSLTEKYRESERPHVRMTELVVEPSQLDFIEVVASSHAHSDHLDPLTLKPLLEANPNITLVIPEASRELAIDRLGCADDVLVGLDDQTSIHVGEFAFTGVASAHEDLDYDDQGRCRNLGYIVLVGPWTIYHAGDTVLYEGLEERLRAFDIDLALLPINGRDPARGVPGNMDAREAAQLARSIDARLAIPCHYEMFEFNSVSPDHFQQECTRLGQAFRILKCGEPWNDRELEDFYSEEAESDEESFGVRGRPKSGGNTKDDYWG